MVTTVIILLAVFIVFLFISIILTYKWYKLLQMQIDSFEAKLKAYLDKGLLETNKKILYKLNSKHRWFR